MSLNKTFNSVLLHDGFELDDLSSFCIFFLVFPYPRFHTIAKIIILLSFIIRRKVANIRGVHIYERPSERHVKKSRCLHLVYAYKNAKSIYITLLLELVS